MLIHRFLEESAERCPDRPALIRGDERSPYGELEIRANRTAHALLALGVRGGDRVALLSRNGSFYVSTYYGILKAGSIAVSLNTAADPRSLAEILTDCEARCLIASAEFTRMACATAARLPTLALLLLERGELPEDLPATVRSAGVQELLPEMPSTRPDLAIDPRRPAAIVYTSGSTGRPRGATLSHLNIVANTRSITRYLRLTRDDRVMDVLPFYYVYGKSLLNTHFSVGGSLVIEESLLFPEVLLDTMEREAVTGLSGVPSTFAILLNRSTLAERSLPALRYVTQAGGAMPPEHIRRLMEALPGKQIFIMYGATEAAARLSYLDPKDLPRKVGSIGKAIPGVELEIVKEDGSTARPGETGEIVARGSNIMLGYWNDDVETAKVMSGRGLHTGDLGRMDEEGFFYVVGRKRDMIKAGAHRISAKEIEEAIIEFPSVHEVAVIGVTDEVLGEAIVAFVTLRPGSDAGVAEILAFCRDRLPPFKVPKEIQIRPQLPKSGAGKIQKETLRREHGGAEPGPAAGLHLPRSSA